MADTNKKAVDVDNATKRKRVTVRLPRLPGQNAIQEDYYAVNGRPCRIKRGETVEIREEIAEVIRNNEMAEDYAMNYVENLDKAKKEKEKELGLK